MIPINVQAPLKRSSGSGMELLVHSIFYTIQGEGPYSGQPAVFIRLGGCNLQCPGCDTEYTEGSEFLKVDAIVKQVRLSFSHRANYTSLPLIVITGGEPFRQDIWPLATSLIMQNFRIQVETNGTLGFDANRIPSFTKKQIGFVVSPKAGKVQISLHDWIIAYKYVVNTGNISELDGLPTSVLGMPAAPARPHLSYRGPVYVSPADQQDERENWKNTQLAVEVAMKYGYTVSLQTHKILDVE